MAPFDYDIGVIGGGAAGLTVAAGSAQLGAKIVLIEAEPRLGGDCLHYGCVPSKTLIKTAKLYHRLQHLERFGLPAVEKKPVDFAAVARRIKSVIDTIQAQDSVERFCRLGAKVEFGSAIFTDEHSVEVDGRKYNAEKWVIASGSSPAVPPVAGLSETGFLTNRDIFYLDKLPASLIVLGGGPVAIEMAQAFARLGCSVHVVQRSGQILSREDRDMADAVMEVLTQEGVRFHLGTRLLRAHRQNGARCLDFEDANGTVITLQAENLLVALGRAPIINHMGLEAIGVDCSVRGIHADRRLRTSQKHIFAAGDVTGSYQFTHAAGYEGGVVISNAIFHLPRKTDYTWLPWCTYTDPELASIGMNEKAAAQAGIDYSVWT
ncbi:MAG: FAD-dependent oxidoreductase, partial [Deltaproteobacteria bacterium]